MSIKTESKECKYCESDMNFFAKYNGYIFYMCSKDVCGLLVSEPIDTPQQ